MSTSWMEWLHNAAPAVADHLWQSTAFAAAAWLLTLALRKNAARVRYGIWVAASLKFLVPFSLLIALGGMLPRPQRVVVTAPVSNAADALAQPFTQDVVTAPIPAIHISALRQDAPAIVAGVWLAGTLIVLLVWTGAWLKVRRMLRHSQKADDNREATLLRRVEVAMDWRGRPIELRLTTGRMEPGMTGILGPVLVWPTLLSERLDDAHIEAILAHELMHARRRDNLTAVLHMAVEALFWFHPLVWWMERRMVEERERACDEGVVQAGRNAETYAESLLEACRFCIETPLVCVTGITGADLNRRVRSILTLRMKRLGWATRTALASFAIGVVAVPLALGLNHQLPVLGQILKAAGPLPSFEVASIRPDNSVDSHQHIAFSGDRVEITATIRTMIERAYGIRDDQLSGGPKWIDTGLYKITAKSDDVWHPQSQSPDQQNAFAYQQMLRLQSLLATRFQLRIHTSTKSMPIFSLVVGNNGPKLQAPRVGERHRLYSSGPGQLACYSASMSEFADELSDLDIGRLVVDRTRLSDRYDFHLHWDPSEMNDVDTRNTGPSIFTAISEQLGLRLVPTKGPVEVIVIDHIERPTVDGAEVPAAAPPSPATPDRGIAATWQGILHTNRDVHVVLKVTKASDGSLQSSLYLIDQGPDAIPAISTTLSGSALKLELPVAAYQGTLSADGNSIAGTWTQGQNTQPLTLARATAETAWRIPPPLPKLTPMAADADPTFEVATIKPTRPDEHGPRYDFRNRRFSVVHASVSDLLKFAYGLQQSQLAKAQDWVNTESFDISAEPDGTGEPSIKQWQSMVAKLLADRFQLKSHFEKREQSVYLLTVAKAGPKLTPSTAAPDAPGGMGFGPPGNFGATNQSMADIANALGQGVLNRPVVDQTGLSGKFSLRLSWTPDGPAAATENPNAPPDFFTAIQEQLGLKVVAARAPVDVLVIDHIEKPTAN